MTISMNFRAAVYDDTGKLIDHSPATSRVLARAWKTDNKIKAQASASRRKIVIEKWNESVGPLGGWEKYA